jgi:MATE family multidrug resistance protein
VANELGAGNGKGARFATIVATLTSLVIGLFFWVLVMGLHDKFALIFTSSAVVLDAVNNLAILLAFTILLNSIQPVLSGTKAQLDCFCHLGPVAQCFLTYGMGFLNY